MIIINKFILQARKRVIGMLTDLIEERRSSPNSHQDMLDSLLQSDEGSKFKMTDEQIIDLIIALIYSGYETVSTTSMMAVKYLHDHPSALDKLRVRVIAEMNSCSFQYFYYYIVWLLISY